VNTRSTASAPSRVACSNSTRRIALTIILRAVRASTQRDHVRCQHTLERVTDPLTLSCSGEKHIKLLHDDDDNSSETTSSLSTRTFSVHSRRNVLRSLLAIAVCEQPIVTTITRTRSHTRTSRSGTRRARNKSVKAQMSKLGCNTSRRYCTIHHVCVACDHMLTRTCDVTTTRNACAVSVSGRMRDRTESTYSGSITRCHDTTYNTRTRSRASPLTTSERCTYSLSLCARTRECHARSQHRRHSTQCSVHTQHRIAHATCPARPASAP
jgi:hypothetical protein